MPRDTTSDQPFFHHCACCGVPLPGRFSPCPACHALPIDSFDSADKPGERTARSRALSVPGTQFEPLPAAASLPADRSSRRSAQTKMSPYDLVDEATFEPSGRRRRHPLALAAFALATLGAAYVGFVLVNGDDASVDTPVTAFGTVHSEKPAQNVAPNAAPSVAVAAQSAAPQPASSVAQPPRPVVVARQQPAPAPAAPVASPAPPIVAIAPSSPPVVTTAPSTAPLTPPVVATAPAVVPSSSRVLATAPSAAPSSPPVVAATPTAARLSPPVVAATPTAAPTTKSSAAIAAPTPRGTAVASINTGTNTTAATLTRADQLRADAERHLKAAHGYLQRGNLSATKARLAAAITAQPDNRDARSMRAHVSTLEQQRDALLSLARGCSTIGHWECASHNANEALRIDSSSKAAQRLVALASQESAWQTLPPPLQESRELRDQGDQGDLRDLLRHH
ncbi:MULTISPECIES: hypothetical protein [Paraburkholderia]|uniref:Uncharacterized protein n=1 Tax=Paraburkholderia podalyriae TaxID=1938811 RepID=A0ABR7PJX4_9BURK|nr:hypothetical protein [Paraburkholderia podalyriae]MBC8746674.1 hypothetical protein [Paraburkholderia podalyriae]